LIYYFDKKRLLYRNVLWPILGIILGTTLLLTLLINTALSYQLSEVKYITEETKAIIIRESQKELEFSPEKLKAYILDLNIRFPHIVYAQARLETGNFQSHIFLNNNNIFGMRQARKRPTTNKGEENGHAYFNSWQESVLDYAMYSAAYLSKISSEEQYFYYLGSNYAEDPNYVSKLKEIISQENLLIKEN